MATERRDPRERTPDYRGPAPAFPIAIAVGGLVLVVGIVVLVFIWVASDDEPDLRRDPGPSTAIVELTQQQA